MYAEFVADLPRFQLLSRISALRSSLQHVHEVLPRAHRQQAMGPQCPTRHPKVTTKIQEEVPRPYGEQEAWSAPMRQCRFVAVPEVVMPSLQIIT